MLLLPEGKHRENEEELLPTDHSGSQPGQFLEPELSWSAQNLIQVFEQNILQNLYLIKSYYIIIIFTFSIYFLYS